MAALISKPGLTSASVAVTIPSDWQKDGQRWMKQFIGNQLQGADVRNAVGANGITISGTIATPYATIAIPGTLALNTVGKTSVTGPPYVVGYAAGLTIPVLSSMNANGQNDASNVGINTFDIANPNIPGPGGFATGHIALRMSANSPSTNGANWGEIGWGSAIYSGFTTGGSGDCSGFNIPLGEGSNVGWIGCWGGRMRHRWGSHVSPTTTTFHDPSSIGNTAGPWYQFGQCTLACSTTSGTALTLMSNLYPNAAIGYYYMAASGFAVAYEQNTSNGDHVFQSSAGGTIDTLATLTKELQIGVHTIGDFFVPQVSTTASAANAFLNSASTPVNQLLRSTSSLRYKTNVQAIQAADIDALLQMRPISYTSLCPDDDPKVQHLGFIAEEMDLIDKRLVHYTNSVHGDPTSAPVPEAVSYERVTVLLVGAIQTLVQRVHALEQQIAAMPAPAVGVAAPAAPAAPLTLSGGMNLTGTNVVATPSVVTGVPARIPTNTR